jgi:hypothetical protein
MPLVRPLDPAFPLERQLQLEAGRVVLVNRRQPDLPELRCLKTDRPLQGGVHASGVQRSVVGRCCFLVPVPEGRGARQLCRVAEDASDDRPASRRDDGGQEIADVSGS